jgi:endonuclease YncB( thermonuclease family)
MRLFLVGLLAFGAHPARAAPCGEAASHGLQVAAVDERLEITLGDGRHLRLAGIEPPRSSPANPGRPAQARDQLRGWLLRPGLRVDLELLAAVPDRWNRLPARLFAPGGAGTVQSVAEAVVEAGLARVEIDPLARPCLRPLLALEAKARRQGLGLWRDPAFAVAAAADRAGLAARAGEVVLVEGLVSGVGATTSRTYVNFGPIRTIDFAATVGRNNLAAFEKSGVLLASLSGKVVRVRGLLETQFGPQIELADPEAIELAAGVR